METNSAATAALVFPAPRPGSQYALNVLRHAVRRARGVTLTVITARTVRS